MRKRVTRVIDTIRNNGIVDDWTLNFCLSLMEQIVKGRSLSPRQKEIFEKKEKQYSSSNIKALADWKETWKNDPDARERFRICAIYYSNTSYYRGEVEKAIGLRAGDPNYNPRISFKDTLNEDYVPSYKIFKSMTQNKYAEKVLDAWGAHPKFENGACVTIRANAHHRAFWEARLPAHKNGKPIAYFIMKSNARTPWGATKGAKVYQVLPVGGIRPFLVEERALKLFKKKKRD